MLCVYAIHNISKNRIVTTNISNNIINTIVNSDIDNISNNEFNTSTYNSTMFYIIRNINDSNISRTNNNIDTRMFLMSVLCVTIFINILSIRWIYILIWLVIASFALLIITS